jgi:hypothetical protein
MNYFASENYVAVFVAAVVAFVIGFLWHGPLFGKQWIALMGIPQAKVDAMRAKGMGPMVPQMIAAVVQQLIIASVISRLATVIGVTGAVQAIVFAIFLWFAFIVTVQLNTVLWENRKMNLYLFTISYHLVSMIAVTLIVVLWR